MNTKQADSGAPGQAMGPEPPTGPARPDDAPFRALCAGLKVGMLIQSPTAEILTSNLRALELLGLTEDQLLGKTSFHPDWNVIHEDGTPFPGPTHPVPRAIATREPVHDVVMGVYRPVTADRVWLLVNASPVLESDGSVKMVVCSFADISERIRAEAALKDSETLRRSVLDSLQANVATLDTAGNILSVNGPWRSFALENGLDRLANSVENANYLEVVRRSAATGEPGSGEVLQGLEEVLGGLRPTFEFEYPCDSPAERRWFRMKITRLEGQQGGAVVVHENITERKRAEEALREAKGRLDFLTSTVPGTVYQFLVLPGGGWAFLHVSKGIEDLYEVTPAEALRDHNALTMRILPEDRTSHRESVERAVRDLGLWVHEHRILTPSGKLKWVRAQAMPTAQGDGSVLWNGILIDITERKLTEEALNASNELLSLFIRHAPVFAFIKQVTPTESRVLHASDNFSRMIGVEARDMVGRTMGDLFPAGLAERMTADDWAVAVGGKVLETAEELNGRSYDTIKFPIIQGDRTLVAGFTIDATERKQLEARKAELEAEGYLLQKAESLGLMAGSIAHHFNNKLQSVMANLELAGGLPQDLDPARFLDQAKKAATQAAEVSRQLLVYLGQSHLAGQPRYLAEICRDSLPILEKGLPAGVTLTMALENPGPIILANDSELHLVLAHLVTNALEALGGGGGSIHLNLRACPADQTRARVHFPINWRPQVEDFACLEVVDTGCGITEADLQKLFDPFFSTKFVGRGLGLPLVLGIVQAHGGVVTVESKPGQGSVFRAFLPVANGAVPEAARTGDATARLHSGGGVLLVDDDEMLLAATGTLIEKLGFTLFTARDGVEAVETYRQNRSAIRLVITDLTMPRMDGWQTLSALRGLEPELPVVLASGYARSQVLATDHPDRPQVFLGKPYSLGQLREAIGQALRAGEA